MLELIQPISKRNQVISAIKDAILTGTIQPGSPLVESKIARQVGAGVPLVREALIELEHQGFVERIPYKGTTVTKLEPVDVQRIFSLRVELEALAIEWAKPNVHDADLDYLRERIGHMKQAAADLDLARFYENDLAFHRKIWLLSDNPYLVDTLERIVTPLFAFFLMKTSRQRESYVDSAAVHGDIVEAMRTSSAAELREMMKASLADWKDGMLTLLFPNEQ